MLFDLKNQKHDGRSSAKTSDDISTNRRNESQTSTANRKYINIVCENILMRCAAYSIFDCAGVLKCTPSNQIIDVCKQVAK